MSTLRRCRKQPVGPNRRTRGTRSDARVASEGPRATVKRTSPFTVGRGPVPRHATIARGTRSDARMASEGPRATVKRTPPFTVGRGPVPRHATIARDRPSPCNDREGQALALRSLKRSRGTGPRATGPETIAGDRPPRYGTENGYFCRFTSPNVVSIRFDAETGPRNIRIANVAGFPSNATSSIW